MKAKFIFPLLLTIFLGFISARLVYAFYNNNNTPKYNCYFLQSGVYKDDKSLKESLKNIGSHVTVNSNNLNYVYVAMTTKIKNAQKLKKVYEQKGVKTVIKEMHISNEEFNRNLEQYDILLNSVTKEDELMAINESILSSYEEMVLKN